MPPAASRLRWSPRRVRTSVMNSRSARKENRPKNTVAPIGPDSQASQNSVVPIHSARATRASSSARPVRSQSSTTRQMDGVSWFPSITQSAGSAFSGR